MQAILTINLFRRPQPTNEVAAQGFLDKNSVIDIVESVEGQKIDGISIWHKAADGFFYWGGGVERINNNVIRLVTALSEPAFDISDAIMGWGFRKLRINELWKHADNRGENITIAILDTGISSTHPEFDFQKIQRFNILGDAIAEDTNGHGSHVAGILVAQGKKVIGVAPNSNLLAIKIAEDIDSWTIENVITGIDLAMQKKADIISISGEFNKKTPNLEALRQKVTDAVQMGITIVASAGNNFNSFPIDNFPAAFDECISVGSIKEDGLRADSSTHSTKLDIVAPGDLIFSAWKEKEYMIDSGTSMAAPFVTGIIAILKSFAKSRLASDLSPSKLQIILNKSADDAGDKDFDVAYGFGIINPINALKLLTQ